MTVSIHTQAGLSPRPELKTTSPSAFVPQDDLIPVGLGPAFDNRPRRSLGHTLRTTLRLLFQSGRTLEPPEKLQKLRIPFPSPNTGFFNGSRVASQVWVTFWSAFSFKGTECIFIQSITHMKTCSVPCAARGLGTQRGVGHCACLPGAQVPDTSGGAQRALSGGRGGTEHE